MCHNGITNNHKRGAVEYLRRKQTSKKPRDKACQTKHVWLTFHSKSSSFFSSALTHDRFLGSTFSSFTPTSTSSRDNSEKVFHFHGSRFTFFSFNKEALSKWETSKTDQVNLHGKRLNRRLSRERNRNKNMIIKKG